MTLKKETRSAIEKGKMIKATMRTYRASGTREFKLRMSEPLYMHASQRAQLLGMTLSEYARDALSFYSYVVDQVSNGGAVAFLDKEGALRSEFWTPKLTRARAHGKSDEGGD